MLNGHSIYKDGAIYTLAVIVQYNLDSIETIISFTRSMFHINHSWDNDAENNGIIT